MNKWTRRVFEGLLIEFIAALISFLFPSKLQNLIVLGVGTLITGLIIFRSSSTQSSKKDSQTFSDSRIAFQGLFSRINLLGLIGASYSLVLAAIVTPTILPSSSSSIFLWIRWAFVTVIFLGLALGNWNNYILTKFCTLILSLYVAWLIWQFYPTNPDIFSVLCIMNLIAFISVLDVFRLE